MTCTSPLKRFRAVEKGPSGKPLLTFNPLKAINSHVSSTIPCGKCIDCRIARVQEWATRLNHESQMHEASCFATLTYDDDHLPETFSVSKREAQLFLKRLRKEIFPTKIRYYLASEYIPETLRPHYHLLIFGYAFPDREFHSTTTGGHRLFTSKQLSKVWPYGFITIGDVTVSSANYTAGYIIDKIGGDKAATHYLRTHPKGYTVTVEPEFALQSSRPGIGYDWLQKFKSDVFPSDFIVVAGKQTRVPRYYLKKLSEEEQLTIQKQRLRQKHKNFAQIAEKKSPERLKARAVITAARLKNRKRTLK